MDPIINKVAESGLITIDLEELHVPGERVLFDIRSWLYEELILREKDFREQIKELDWSAFSGKHVAVTCSADAVIPVWAYMLIAASLAPYAQTTVFGSLERLEESLFLERLNCLDLSVYKDQRVIIKGCSAVPVPVSAYFHLTSLLQPIVKSVMYGEPCSTVPVYKRK
ncbi:MAG: hypothetical protein RL021_1619 [Bacteroidota bacterium]|jgi:hypothetical protein